MYDRARHLQGLTTQVRERLAHAGAQLRLSVATGSLDPEMVKDLRLAADEITELLALDEARRCLPTGDLIQLRYARDLVINRMEPALGDEVADVTTVLFGISGIETAMRRVSRDIIAARPARRSIAAIEAENQRNRTLFGLSVVAALGAALLIHRRHRHERRDWVELQSFISLFGHMTRSWFASLRLALGGLKGARPADREMLVAADETVAVLEVVSRSLLRLANPKMDKNLEPAGQIVDQLAMLQPGVTVRFDPRAAAARVPADQFRALVAELLNNAAVAVVTKPVPHIAVHGRIRSRWSLAGRSCMLVIDVVDNGCGMPPEVARRATTPFFSTRGAGHAGLGLTCCERTVQALAGRLRIITCPRSGTTVQIELPVGRDD